MIDAAVRLGARSLRIHPGKDRTRETGFALIPFFKDVAAEAEKRNLWLGIETHGGLSSDAPAMVELCEQVGSDRFGVLYDPFVARALEPWAFGMYAGGQSILVGTPSGVSLAPEGGAHQSITTPSMLTNCPVAYGKSPRASAATARPTSSG